MGFPIRIGANAIVLRDDSVLLIEFDNEDGLHYNFPGGGIEPDETVEEGLKREVQEEACAQIELGMPLVIREYEPKRNAEEFGPTHKVGIYFICSLVAGSEPEMPEKPDPGQTAVKWIPLKELPTVQLLPRITDWILAYSQDPENTRTVNLCEPIGRP